MVFQSVAQERAYQAIVSQIERQIAIGNLSEGDQLPGERELAGQFGVSRTVIREAMRNLQARQIVQVRHNSGTYISKPGDMLTQSLTLLLKLEESSLLELYLVRQALELVAAPPAPAQYATANDIDLLKSSLADMENIVGRGIEVEEHFHIFTHSDIELHARVAEASHNAPLATLLRAILSMIMSGRLEMINRTGGFKRFIARSIPSVAMEEHSNIVSAIINHDPKAAEHFVYKHLQRSMATYRDLPTQVYPQKL